MAEQSTTVVRESGGRALGVSSPHHVDIKKYFEVNERGSDDLRILSEEPSFVDIISTDGNRGYIFIGNSQSEQDFLERGETAQARNENMGRRTLRKVIEYDEALVAFSWRKD